MLLICGRSRRKLNMFHLTQSIGTVAATEAARKKPKAFGSVNIDDLTVCFEAMLYPDLNLALDLHIMKDGRPVEPYTTLTVRPRHYDPLQSDEVLVKTYSENEHLRGPMLASGHFVDTARRVQMNFSEFEIWQIAPPFVRAFMTAYPLFVVPQMYLCPPKCYIVNPSAGEGCQVMEVRRGCPAEPHLLMGTPGEAADTSGTLNRALGVSSFEQEAMVNGLKMGWDAPEVDPELVRLVWGN